MPYPGITLQVQYMQVNHITVAAVPLLVCFCLKLHAVKFKYIT